MSTEQDPAATNGAGEPSRLVLEFGAPGSAELSIRTEGRVSTGQLYAAAWFLDAYARQVHQGAMPGVARLVVPAAGGQLGPLGHSG